MLTTLVRMLRITLSSCHAFRHPLAPPKTVMRLHLFMLLFHALTLIRTYSSMPTTLTLMLTFIVIPMPNRQSLTSPHRTT